MTAEMIRTLSCRGKLVLAEKAVTYRTVRKHKHNDPAPCIDNPDNAKAILQGLFDRKPVEVLYAIALNSCGDLLGMLKLSEGTIDRASVYPRELVSFLLVETNASAVIIAHNHPGGRTEASQEDIQLTRRIRDILQPMGVRFLDHLIYSCGRPGRPHEWLSLRSMGEI